MLSFFRFNDPYRLIFVFMILLIIRIPFFLTDNVVTEADLRYMVIGEKMSSGASMYIDIWDNVAPLSACVYWFLDIMFGRSILAYQIFSLLLVTVQAALFNRLLLSNKAINENSYVPALIYGICMSLFFDFFTLTPVLMSITFLLLSLNHMFDHIEIRAKRDEQIFSIGLYIGIASLFYLPVIGFAPAILIILMLFTGTVFRRYLLLSFGIALPLLLLIGYYLLKNGVRDLYYNFFNPWANFQGENIISFTGIIMIIAVPGLYALLGIMKITQGVRFTNYQLRLTQVMFIWFLFSVVLIFPGIDITPAKLMIIMPPVAFYVVHYFLSFRRGIKSELAFALFFIWIGLLATGTFYGFFFTARFIDYKELLLEETPYDELVKGKSIVVFGDNMHLYRQSELATPYLNWDLSRELVEEPQYYDNVMMISKAFRTDPPDVIIDPESLFEKLAIYIPWLSENYSRRETGVYILNN